MQDFFFLPFHGKINMTPEMSIYMTKSIGAFVYDEM